MTFGITITIDLAKKCNHYLEKIMIKIDIHTHIIPGNMPDFSKKFWL